MLASATHGEIRFSGSIDKTKLTLGDNLTLILEASGKEVTNNMPEPQVPALEGFRLVDKRASMSSSSSMRIIINGKDMSKEAEKKVTWQYVLSPKAAGTFTIPSFVLTFNGKNYQTNPVAIEVSREQTQSQDVTFECIPKKRSVYIGEQFRCTFRLAIRHGANAYNPQRPLVEEELRKYFWVEELAKGEIKGRRENINGVLWDVFDIPFALYPIQSGRITIPSFVLQYQEQQRVQRRNPFDAMFDDPFFNGFMGSGVQAIPKQKTSLPVSIQVLDLPNKPADFSGSVGRFTLSATADKNALPAGEALTYTVTLQGNSSLRNMKDPVISPINGFDIFEPEKKTKTLDKNGQVWGACEYKYVMIPQREGTFTIEPARYTYFDVESKTYLTAKTKPFTVKVTPGKQVTTFVSGQKLMSKQEIKQLGQDIRFIKTGRVVMKNAGKPLHRSVPFVFLQFLPPMAVLFSFLYKRQRRRMIEDIGYARRSQSKKQVRKRLSQAKGYFSANKPAEFYAALSKGILGYIGDLLNVEAIGMTTDGLRNELASAGQEQATIDEIIALLQKADFARFATSTLTSREMKTDLEKTENMLNKFDPKKIKV